MTKHTVDVAVIYVQTIEVDADSAEEAKETALDRFEACDAEVLTMSATVAYVEPTKGETT